MEPVEVLVVDGAVDSLDLGHDRVGLRRHCFPVQLEVLRDTVHAGKFGEERGVPRRRRGNDPRQEEHVGHDEHDMQC